ncbi:response regulator [Pseudosulfitobacter koreensis]|uniref:Response regulator n=1 Tax=Pseudosulfitobacter koreensis TaxID=2968472 RepID=A0ABT1YXL9_9RHOB|nr:response regulator [Pseudosulfitobacter koreense]MCR8825625.1 response regulator [Pseudosulfitobacter koreense]
MSEKPTVVIVEDDFLIAEDLRTMSEDFGANVLAVRHAASGTAEKILALAPDFVLMDVRLGGDRDGVSVAQQIYRTNTQIKLIFVTGSNEPQTIERIETDHPHRILIKPISPDQLREALGFD